MPSASNVSPANPDSLPAPIFQLEVRDGSPAHLPGHASRAFEMKDVTVRTDAAGVGVLCFNGKNSSLRYQDAAWPELNQAGSQTLRVRARFTQPEGEQFVAGRYGRSFISVIEGWPQANANPTATAHMVANGRIACRPDRFYDVFLRLRPDAEGRAGAVTATVYEADGGALVGRSRDLLRAFEAMRLGSDVFTVGQGGRYASFAGEIALVSLWGEWLDDARIETVVGAPNSQRRQRLAVRPDLHDARASARWYEWLAAREQFPIAAWGYFQRYRGNEEEYRIYREANLTMVMAPLGTAEVAEKAGLDTILGLWGDDNQYLELYAHPDRMREFVGRAQAKLRRVAGYMLADEPRYNGPAIEELRPGFDYLYAHEKRALPIVNLMTYPYTMGGGFVEYVERFMREVRPPFLVSDAYVLYRGNLSNDDTFYANNEVIRQKALEADIGFMGFVLTTGHGRPHGELSPRTASESDLQWQVNVMLAYGALGIWYYNYRIDTTDGVFDEAMVTHATGRPTRNYAYIKKINAGVLANGAVLMSLRSVSVLHCLAPWEANSELTRRYANGAIRGLASLGGTGLVVAEFEERALAAGTGPAYVMVVNRRHTETAEAADPAVATTVTFKLEPGVRAELFDSETGVARPLSPSADETHTLSLAGGARALLRLNPR